MRTLLFCGSYVALRIAVDALDKSNGGHDYSLIFQIVFVLFVLGSWLAHPFFNLLLATDPFGRQALTAAERAAAYAVGAILASAIFGAILGGAIGFPPAVAALIYAVLVIPASSAGKCAPGATRIFMIALTVALVLIGTTGVLLVGDVFGAKRSADGIVCILIGLIGSLFSTVLGNILATSNVNR
jgi:hypothetical protein